MAEFLPIYNNFKKTDQSSGVGLICRNIVTVHVPLSRGGSVLLCTK